MMMSKLQNEDFLGLKSIFQQHKQSMCWLRGNSTFMFKWINQWVSSFYVHEFNWGVISLSAIKWGLSTSLPTNDLKRGGNWGHLEAKRREIQSQRVPKVLIKHLSIPPTDTSTVTLTQDKTILKNNKLAWQLTSTLA